MKVTLRQRNQGGQTSLYLDYYHKGKRKTEYLKLYLDPNAKTKEEKEVNKKTMQLAETIRAQRQIEIQNGVYGFRDQEKQKGSFLSYIELLAQQRDDSPGNHGNWTSMIKHLKAFCTYDLSFTEVDRQLYWKSVRQQNLPVTIKYPEMVAEMLPYFEGNEIPDYGKDNLWFL